MYSRWNCCCCCTLGWGSYCIAVVVWKVESGKCVVRLLGHSVHVDDGDVEADDVVVVETAAVVVVPRVVG